MSGPRVLREGAGVVAVWKPAGLATQAPPGIASAEAWLRERLHGGRPGGYLGVPHRLDRGVSGVVLFAATPRAARQLSRQFERRQVTKRYLAIVAGERLPGAGAAGKENTEHAEHGSATLVEWHDTIEKIPDLARARIVPSGTAGGRAAHTRARLVRGLPGGRLLLELLPVTGRMHQLRLQAAARGLPVVGDDLYGGENAEWSARVAAADDVWRDEGAVAAAIALHAVRIDYADPDGGGPVAVAADLPGYWPAEAGAVTTA